MHCALRIACCAVLMAHASAAAVAGGGGGGGPSASTSESGGGVDAALASAASTLENLRALNTFLAGGFGGGDAAGKRRRCEFLCRNGRKPEPRPGYRATFNGCGSKEFRMDTSQMPDITNCCNQHDICYGTCNARKSSCEAGFRRCLTDACELMRSSGKLPNQRAYDACRNLGDTFHETVVNFGCQFYLDAQAEACTCGEEQGHKGSDSRGGSQKPSRSQDEEDQQHNNKNQREFSFLNFPGAHAFQNDEL